VNTVQHISREDRQANVPHDCDCCGGEILPGQTYTRVFFTTDGEPQTLKYHKARSEVDECLKKRRDV